MTRWLSLFCITFCYQICFAEIKTIQATKASDADYFMPYADSMMALPKFPEKHLKNISTNGKKIYRIPVSILKEYGLKVKPGTKVQSVDLKSGNKVEYSIKEIVNAIYSPNQMEGLDKGHLLLILSDDKAIIDGYSSKTSIDFFAKGFSYFGDQRKIFPAKERLIPTERVFKKFVFKNKAWNPEEDGVEIRAVKIFNNVLYVKNNSNEGMRFVPVLKTQTSYYPLTVNNSILTKDLKFLHASKWGKDTEVLMLLDINAYEDSCFDLIFVEKASLSYVPLPCSHKGRWPPN